MIQQLAKASDNASQLSLIAYALKSKKADFSKVLGMIDNMVTLLGKEQGDDDAQKSMCDKDFEESAEHKKETEEAIANSEATIGTRRSSRRRSRRRLRRSRTRSRRSTRLWRRR